MPHSTNAFLEDQNNIYFRCVEDSFEPIMITDTKGVLVYVNSAWCKTYGYSRKEALGLTPRILRSPHQDQAFYDRMWARIRDPQHAHWRGQLINKAKDGHEVPVMLTITPYKNSPGEITGYMGIALDLSEQKRLEEHIAHQERLATIGELTGGLAHEIGTPIGVIRGRAEMLLMETPTEHPMAKALDTIIKQSDRITGLITTLLRLTRAQESQNLRPIPLHKVVQEVLALLAEKTRALGVKTQVDIDESVSVLGDATKLEQILINLIVNALHAIEMAKPEPKEKWILLRSHRLNHTDGNHVALDVCDSGGGVPEKILGKIFQPFFTTKPAGKGTGLGLSIVQRLVHEMDGSVSASNLQGGACFTIKLKAPQS